MAAQTLVDPTTQPIPISFAEAPRLRDLRGKTLGLIDDSKPNAKELLDELAALLEDRFETRVGMYHRKPSASKPADPNAVTEMAEKCDYVIVAVGDWGSCSACSVHDGVHVEKAGIPAAVVCTDRFKVTGEAMAKMWGAPEFPILYTAHPVGGLDRDRIRARAEELIDQVIAVLTGVEVSQVSPKA